MRARAMQAGGWMWTLNAGHRGVGTYLQVEEGWRHTCRQKETWRQPTVSFNKRLTDRIRGWMNVRVRICISENR